jgi:ubiquinone/menaquinone biosynthesis C-methylase UbiE
MDINYGSWKKYWLDKNYKIGIDDNIEFRNAILCQNVVGKKIIEIGSGRGVDAIELAKLGADVYVLDYIAEALEITRKLADENHVVLNYLLADAQSIPIEDNFFDIIYHAGFLEHFKAPEPILLEQLRVLKKGGLIYISVPQTYTLYTVKKQLLQFFNLWFAGWETQFSSKQLRSLTEKSGFKFVSSFGYGYYPGLLWRIFELDRSKRWNKFLPKSMMNLYKSIMGKYRKTTFALYKNLHIVIVAEK